MATLLTVHGTGATGPPMGDQWWQSTSEFDKDARTLIESANGEAISFVPFIWNGANSEASRRSAADKLAKVIESLEKSKQHYAIVAHSHGGSVVLHAAATLKTLQHLSQVVLVASPLLETRRSGFFYARLGTVAKIAFLTNFLFFLYYGAMIMDWIYRGETILWDTAGTILAIFPTWFLLTWLLDKYGPRTRRLVSARGNISAYSARIVRFNHENDEAITALRSASTVTRPIFDEWAFLPLLTNLSVLATPIVLLIFLRLLIAAEPIPLPSEIGESRLGVFSGIDYLLAIIVEKLIPAAAIPQGAWSVLTIYSSVLVILCLAAFAIHSALKFVIGHLARFISQVANNATWLQLKRLVYGADIIGYSTRFSSDAALRFPILPFPQDLSTAIIDQADSGASETIIKLRRMVSAGFSTNREGNVDFLNGSLTWNELVHTTYFKVPLFRKLVCLAIAQSPGFRASAQFERDENYTTLARWLADGQPKT